MFVYVCAAQASRFSLAVPRAISSEQSYLTIAQLRLKAAHAMIDAHVSIGESDLFAERRILPLQEAALVGDAVQDPHCTLYTGLTLLTQLGIEDATASRIAFALSLRTRVHVASVLVFAHKLCTSSHREGYSATVAALQAVCAPFELPTDLVGWNRLTNIVASTEVRLAALGKTHSIFVNIPIHWMDRRLMELKSNGHVSENVALVLRGGAFFFLGAGFLNPEAQVILTLVRSVGPQAVGEGLLMILILCYGLSQPKPRWFRLGVGTSAHRAGTILLKNSLARHADKMRRNVYSNSDTLVGRMVSRKVLESAEKYLT